MSNFLMFMFIFFVGSCLGWILELLFRGLVYKKWINPGLLVGPYLPIYGFGLCALTFIYLNLYDKGLNFIIIILLMGVAMTLIELVGGLIFIRGAGIKLWDYSKNWGNYKGIICPLFSFIWTLIGAVYYFFIADNIVFSIEWYAEHLSFSFVLGMFFAIIIIDFVYSTKILVSIRKYATNNEIVVKYEELKKEIREAKKSLKEKTSFIFPFKHTGNLLTYLESYKGSNKNNKRNKNTCIK